MANLETAIEGVRAALADAPMRLAVFNHLWKHRNVNEKVSAKDLWNDVLSALSQSEKPKSARIEHIASARQVCMKLREDLETFFTPQVRWHYRLGIELPEASRSVAYKLKVETLEDTASMAFWRPHMAGANSIPLVFVKPMFFLDIKTGCHLRWLDTNPRSAEGAVYELMWKHPEELKALYGSVEAARERLRPTHVYVGMGDMAGLEKVTRWFHRWPWMTTEWLVDTAVANLQGKSPVLFGSEHTHRYIRGNMDQAQCAYRIHPTEPFYVTVENPTQPEQEALAALFPPSLMRQEGNRLVIGKELSLSVKRTRLALLTRIPNPESPGRPITMITSDTTLAIQQVAHAVTDDEQLSPIMSKLGWPLEPLPPAFEMLFSVEIAPSGVDDIAGMARLLAPPRRLPFPPTS